MTGRRPARDRGRPPAPSAPPSPARKALVRLRLRLTIAYTVLTVIGLGVLSAVAIETDARSRRTAEFDEMKRRATVARSLIYDADGRLDFDALSDDDITDDTAVLVVLKSQPDGTLRPVFSGGHPTFHVSTPRLLPVARSALSSDDTATSVGRDDSGHSVYYLATPFYEDTSRRQAGVVAVAADAGRGSAAHHRLIAALLVGCAALAATGAATGHLLFRRSMRPAWEAHEQHERLLADAAHELRTPVAVIRGAVDLLGPSGARSEHLPRITTAADRLADVVDNLLTRGRLQAGAHPLRLDPLRLDQLVETVCAELPAGGHRVHLDLTEAVVTADAGLVRTAVRNLLDNALRHGASTPGRDDADLTVTVRGAEVSVADRGPGIAAAEVPAVFARYHSLRGSTGIGLSLVQWIADAHEGSVDVRPRPGGGSVFTLRLAPERTRRWWHAPGRRG